MAEIPLTATVIHEQVLINQVQVKVVYIDVN